MTDHAELARLEAERDHLRSVIAYYSSPPYQSDWGEWRASGWLVAVAIAVVGGIAIALIAGIVAGQVSPWGLLGLLIALPVLWYTFSRVSWMTFDVGDMLILIPDLISRRPIGENEARQRLAECEARIAKLREGRS
jgi:hypothetical protein